MPVELRCVVPRILHSDLLLNTCNSRIVSDMVTLNVNPWTFVLLVKNIRN